MRRHLVCLALLASCSAPATPDAPPSRPPQVDRVEEPSSRAEPTTRAPTSGDEATAPLVLRHVLVAYRGAEHARNVRRSREEARARAIALQTRLIGGEDFEAVARAESDGPSASLGGALGEVGRGILDPAVERAAFALPLGGISEVVESRFGFHVILRER